MVLRECRERQRPEVEKDLSVVTSYFYPVCKGSRLYEIDYGDGDWVLKKIIKQKRDLAWINDDS